MTTLKQVIDNYSAGLARGSCTWKMQKLKVVFSWSTNVPGSTQFCTQNKPMMSKTRQAVRRGNANTAASFVITCSNRTPSMRTMPDSVDHDAADASRRARFKARSWIPTASPTQTHNNRFRKPKESHCLLGANTRQMRKTPLAPRKHRTKSKKPGRFYWSSTGDSRTGTLNEQLKRDARSLWQFALALAI